MKKLFILVVFLCLLLSVTCFAANFPDKNNPNCVEWVLGEDGGKGIAFYYAPELTNLSEQGRLDTWIKMVVTKKDGTVDEFSISHEFVNPAFDKYKSVKTIKFDKNNKLSGGWDDFEAKWIDVPPGSAYEETLTKALKYAKNK